MSYTPQVSLDRLYTVNTVAHNFACPKLCYKPLWKDQKKFKWMKTGVCAHDPTYCRSQKTQTNYGSHALEFQPYTPYTYDPTWEENHLYGPPGPCKVANLYFKHTQKPCDKLKKCQKCVSHRRFV
jgi:hypothetical protein